MKRIFLLLCLTLCVSCIQAQGRDADRIGMIALNVHVQDDKPMAELVKNAIKSKLNQIVTRNGCAGQGFDDRFIITAHPEVIQEATTGTAPAKFAVNLSVTVYVGDAKTGTLFSSWNTEVKGVGNTQDIAWASAIRKIPVRDALLLASIETGKQKIIEYYEASAPSILTQADTQAKAGEYAAAIATLMAIPAQCSYYTKARALVVSYGQTAADNSNMQIINNARSAWAASPDETGAAEADRILSMLENPSAKILAESRKLCNDMESRLKAVSDREFNLQKRQAAYEHELDMQRTKSDAQVEIAQARAAAKVATAYYNAKPRVVHHVHWW